MHACMHACMHGLMYAYIAADGHLYPAAYLQFIVYVCTTAQLAARPLAHLTAKVSPGLFAMCIRLSASSRTRNYVCACLTVGHWLSMLESVCTCMPLHGWLYACNDVCINANMPLSTHACREAVINVYWYGLVVVWLHECMCIPACMHVCMPVCAPNCVARDGWS